jgi:uncharacterized membrane protein
MKSVRVVAVGITLAGILMALSGQEFFGPLMHQAALNAWQSFASNIDPSAAAKVASLPQLSDNAFAMLCLGVGLLISSSFYAALEEAFEVAFVGGPALVVYGCFAGGKWLYRRMRPKTRALT